MDKEDVFDRSKTSTQNRYLGNPNVKRDAVTENLTKTQILEYSKCMDDPSYFAKNYIKVISLDEGLVSFNLYPYQEKMMSHFQENRYSIVLACRQSGKSISSCAYLLWYGIFQPDKTIAILANKGSTAKEMLARITLMLENLPFWLQPGCKALNKGSIEFSNKSRILASSTSSSSIRGFSVNLLYLDEFAFVDNDVQFYTSTYPVISSGNSSQVIITSTANGIGNQFYKLWEGASQQNNEFLPFRVDWWDVPGRDEGWKKKTIANTSEIQFEQEFGNAFHGGGDTLLSSNVLMGLKTFQPELTHNSVRIYKKPDPDRHYMMFVDIAHGRGQDYSTFNIIDVSSQPFEQVAVYQNNTISPLLFPDIIYKYGTLYNNAYVILESNDQGTLVGTGLYYELEYENVFLESSVKSDIGIRMTKKVKRIGCSNMKDLIESGKLNIIDGNTIEELSTFKARGSSYEAADGCHDDLVMNLVLLGYFTTLPFFSDLTDINIRHMIHEQNIKMIEDDLVPFGLVNDGSGLANGLDSSYFPQESTWNG